MIMNNCNCGHEMTSLPGMELKKRKLTCSDIVWLDHCRQTFHVTEAIEIVWQVMQSIHAILVIGQSCQNSRPRQKHNSFY